MDTKEYVLEINKILWARANCYSFLEKQDMSIDERFNNNEHKLLYNNMRNAYQFMIIYDIQMYRLVA